MQLRLKYDREILEARVRFADYLGELVPRRVSSLQPPEKIIRKVLEKPVGSFPFQQLFRRGKNLVIVVPDNTRKSALPTILPVLLDELNRMAVPDEEIKILVANGAHRKLEDDEIRALVGPEVVKKIPVFQHDCHDTKQLEYIGETRRGTSVFVNKLLVDADEIIVVGTVVHHYFAGYGGGPKMVVPGCAGYETIRRNHALAICDNADGKTLIDPKCSDGVIEGNPLQDDLREAFRFLSVRFGFYAILNSHDQIIAAFAGQPLQAHAAGCRMIDTLYRVPIKEKADLTIVSCGGAPKDINYIQSHKALHHASYATKDGGSIVFVAACCEGIGSSTFLPWLDMKDRTTLHTQLRSHFALNGTTATATIDKAARFNVILVSALEKPLVETLGFRSAANLQEAIDLALTLVKAPAKTYVIPDGSLTVPILSL